MVGQRKEGTEQKQNDTFLGNDSSETGIRKRSDRIQKRMCAILGRKDRSCRQDLQRLFFF